MTSRNCNSHSLDEETSRAGRELLRVSRDRSEKVQGGLCVGHRAGLLRGGDSGPAVVPNQAEKSLLLKAFRLSRSRVYEILQHKKNSNGTGAPATDSGGTW
ncbi:c-type cytochrome domain-containing protein [Rubinisphaera italica]|uniref:Cytochrome C Planctomycete-type domain-containing protein n=1 Tax=Rubinisphaera italica TaxID=2527969 RepID=A0A5C5XEB0_9PLAN|nr:c-type cytochrome domain-containing protein [Rubinisphaera italica]TWT60643.1 hypothetical protein Pan54_13570 [Rubinisphaera italica]